MVQWMLLLLLLTVVFCAVDASVEHETFPLHSRGPGCRGEATLSASVTFRRSVVDFDRREERLGADK
jgi:hypothetical protein